MLGNHTAEVTWTTSSDYTYSHRALTGLVGFKGKKFIVYFKTSYILHILILTYRYSITVLILIKILTEYRLGLYAYVKALIVSQTMWYFDLIELINHYHINSIGWVLLKLNKLLLCYYKCYYLVSLGLFISSVLIITTSIVIIFVLLTYHLVI